MDQIRTLEEVKRSKVNLNSRQIQLSKCSISFLDAEQCQIIQSTDPKEDKCITLCGHTLLYLTVEDGGRVVEKGVGGKEEQVGAV